MQNRNEPNSPSNTQPYGTPEADIVVFAGDHRSGRRAARLNTLTDGVNVIVAGTIQDVREHGSMDSPRATLQLVNDFGQATYAAADVDTLATYSMCLMDGLEVSLHGIVRQPFPEDPRTSYIQIVRVEPLFG
ncbi:hypothetical protein ACGFNY_45430 [Streptomyces chartreusis]|uniref:hypothetical protein n=1 Tax=Streptomyces chartreusis TaxID=1969 RepID=UPI0037151E94